MKYGPLVFFNQYYLQLGKSKAKKLKTQKGRYITFRIRESTIYAC